MGIRLLASGKFQADPSFRGVRAARLTFETEKEAKEYERAAKQALKKGKDPQDLVDKLRGGGQAVKPALTKPEFLNGAGILLQALQAETERHVWAPLKTAHQQAETAQMVVEDLSAIIAEEHLRQEGCLTNGQGRVADRALVATRARTVTVDEVKLEHIEEAIARWREDGHRKTAEGLKPGTINGRLRVLRAMLRRAVAKGYLDRMPTIKNVRNPSTKLRYWTEEEMSHLLWWFGARNRLVHDMLIVGIDLGYRFSEITSLQVRDFNHQTGLLVLGPSKTDSPRANKTTKRVRAIIEKRIEGKRSEDPIFESITNARVSQLFQDWKEAFGLPKHDTSSFHVSRHTCCTRLAAKSAPTRAIMHYLGHKRLETTQGYMHVTPDAGDICHELLDDGE